MAAVHTPVTRWAGKGLGAAAALIFAPADPTAVVWWLAAGILSGHLVDSLVFGDDGDAQDAAGGNDADDQPGRLPAATVRFTFAALGRLAAASGQAGPEHQRCAERLMARLAFDCEQRQEALMWFRSGQDRAFPFDATAQACRPEFAAHPVLRDLAMDALSRMTALADTPAATEALLALGESVGFGRDQLAIRAVAAAALMPARSALDQARDTLGVRPDDNAETIRLAYRRRVSRWHPDRLAADAGDEERALAAQRMCQLREALDTLLATTAS